MPHGSDGSHGFDGHHPNRGFHGGFGFGLVVPVPEYGYDPNYGYSSAPYAYGAPGYWYYCPSYGAYYPNVATCPEAWVPVPAS